MLINDTDFNDRTRGPTPLFAVFVLLASNALYLWICFADRSRWPVGSEPLRSALPLTVACLLAGVMLSVGMALHGPRLLQAISLVARLKYLSLALVPLTAVGFELLAETRLRGMLAVIAFLLPLADLVGSAIRAGAEHMLGRTCQADMSASGRTVVRLSLGLLLLGQLTLLAFFPVSRLITLLWDWRLAWIVPAVWLILASRRRDQEPTPQPGPWCWRPVLLRGVTWGCLLPGLLLCLLPPAESDELRYHLSSLRIWLEGGQMSFLPANSFTNLPFHTEMLFAWPGMAGFLGGAKVVHWVFLTLTVVALGQWVGCDRRPVPAAGWLAALAYASVPAVMVLASWAFVDLTLVFWTVFAFWMLDRWSRHGQVEDMAVAWLAAAGALACKHTGLAAAGLVACGLLYAGWQLRAGLLKIGVAGIICLLIIAGPWWTRAWRNTGNPFYPLAWQVFSSPEWNAFTQGFYEYQSGQKGSLEEFRFSPVPVRLVDLVTLPVRQVLGLRWLDRATLQTLLSGWPERVQRVDFGAMPVGPLPLVVMVLALALLVTRWGRLQSPYLPAAALLLWLFWAATYRDNRMALSAWVLLAVFYARNLPPWSSSSRNGPRWSDSLWTAGVMAGLGGGLLINFAEIGPSWRMSREAVVGSLSSAAFLEQRLDYWQAAGVANGLLFDDSERILVIGWEQGYYYASPVISDFFDIPVEVRLAEWAADADQLHRSFQQQGIAVVAHHAQHMARHPLVAWRHMLHFLPPANAAGHLAALRRASAVADAEGMAAAVAAARAEVFASRAWQVFQQWLSNDRYMTRVAEHNGVVIYRLRSID